VLLEVALCEVAVVELDLQNTEGTFVDGVTGRLAPPSPQGLARTLGEVLADREAARALGRRAREYALGFTWDAAAEAVERHLFTGLGSAPPRPAAPRPGGSARNRTDPSDRQRLAPPSRRTCC
jgi:Glycosyl transferases group 1